MIIDKHGMRFESNKSAHHKIPQSPSFPTPRKCRLLAGLRWPMLRKRSERAANFKEVWIADQFKVENYPADTRNYFV
jgi:hypothetical protein